MEKSLEKKNVLVIVFEILVISLAVGGITFATSKLLNNRTTTVLKVGEYGLDYVGDTEVSINGIEPMDDSLVNIDTSDNVIRLEFSLKGVSSNKEKDLIYDIMLNNINIDCSLLNKFTKWRLFKNGKLLSYGSLDPMFDGNILSDNMRLTDIQEDLPDYNQEYDKYVLIFWISEACDDINTCELIDQSNIANSSMDMKIFIALYSGAKKKNERIPNYDNSCANRPELYDNMVAVTYKNGEWVVADTTNSDKDNLWYNYGNQKWANAVIVSDNKYSKVGEVINNCDVLGYYVWIPRFRYKLWNVEDIVTDSYGAYDDGINIIFENGLGKTSNELKNNEYLTHLAFGDNLRGFWISKYELSKDNENYKFIPNVQSYYGDTLEEYENIINGLSAYYNLDEKIESHIISNLEWGAVTYLSHSKYGLCSGDGCTKIDNNTSYVSGSNKWDTTTRNVYGVYDMAGGAGEYAVGSEKVGNATSEVMLAAGGTWYQDHGMLSDRDYIIRGGLNRGMFYFGDKSMDPVEITTRSVLVNK